MKKTLLLLSALAAPSVTMAQTVPALDAPIATQRDARTLRANSPVVLQAQPAAGALSAPRPTPPQLQAQPSQAAGPPSAPVQMVPSAPLHAPPPIAAPVQRVKLTTREAKSVEISNSWQQNRSMPTPGNEGAVIFGFGATLPTIVCAPLFICDLQLQAGEMVNDISLGDSVRWKISPSASGGSGEKVTHVLIKPTDAGLTTNLVVTTDRRVYVIKLVSDQKSWMARVAFTYPDEVRAEWEDFLANQRAEKAMVQAAQIATRTATVLPTGEAIDRLDFNFDIRGDKPSWRPLRVYSNGHKTYIEFPRELRDDEAPALVGVGPGNTLEVINVRAQGNRYIVDQVIDRVALISGVGRRQVRVDIQRSKAG